MAGYPKKVCVLGASWEEVVFSHHVDNTEMFSEKCQRHTLKFPPSPWLFTLSWLLWLLAFPGKNYRVMLWVGREAHKKPGIPSK